ncbi:unnamed protein product [Orchesella dallaii]|uniref:Odorant receptor n=1 Tax=Orchesella dallaii TaxID=48710 RepID=A0ABP1QD89_9HEXA
MLLHENFLKFIKINLRVQEAIGTFPVTFSSKNMLVLRNGGRLKLERIKTLIFIFYCITLWCELFHEGKSVPRIITLESLLCVTGMTNNCLVRCVVFEKREYVAEVFNLFVQFEKRHLKGIRTSKMPPVGTEVRVLKTLLLFAIGYAPSVAIPYSMLQWFMGCNSINFGYFTIPACHSTDTDGNWSIFSIIQLTLFCIIGCWFVIDVIGGFALFVINFSLVQAYCLRRYVQYITSCLIAKPEKGIVILPYFRQVQLLVRYYNNLQQDKLILMALFIGTASFCLSYFVIIALGVENISVPELLFFLVIANYATLFTNLYTKMMSRVYGASTECNLVIKQKVLPKVPSRERKWVERYVKSFPLLKCYIGYNNYVDELTPLTLYSFCVDQTVSLLMVQ